MRLDRFRGYILAAVAAALYGTNPVFAVPLYAGGMNPTSVLLFRYILSVPIIAVIMLVRHTSFSLRKDEIGPVAVLGILMSLSSLGLFASYEYLNAGVASTLLFIYPIMVAVMMIFFFHEKFKMTVAVCLVLMSAGLLMLMKPQEGGSVSMMGLLLVFLSSLTYALYIVMVNVSKAIRAVPTTKLLFYTLVWGMRTVSSCDSGERPADDAGERFRLDESCGTCGPAYSNFSFLYHSCHSTHRFYSNSYFGSARTCDGCCP